MKIIYLCILALALLTSSCSNDQGESHTLSANTATAEHTLHATLDGEQITPTAISLGVSLTSTSTQYQGKKMDDFRIFATDGAKLLDYKTGDLNGDGKPDALLVIDPLVTGNEQLGKGPPRNVLLLIRDTANRLQKVAQNDKIVPCAQCGGIVGDPYSYTQIANNSFTLVTEGGSREHWSNEYTFIYSPEQKDWLLHEVKREVTDQESSKKRQLDMTSKDLGVVTFKDFNPSTLPSVELP